MLQFSIKTKTRTGTYTHPHLSHISYLHTHTTQTDIHSYFKSKVKDELLMIPNKFILSKIIFKKYYLSPNGTILPYLGKTSYINGNS